MHASKFKVGDNLTVIIAGKEHRVMISGIDIVAIVHPDAEIGGVRVRLLSFTDCSEHELSLQEFVQVSRQFVVEISKTKLQEEIANEPHHSRV